MRRERPPDYADRLPRVVPRAEDDISHLSDEMAELLYPGRRPRPFCLGLSFEAFEDSDYAAAVDLARRSSLVLILVSTVFGAISGVGIWVVAGLISPATISALIRNYVWGWAIEWTFFFVEIVAALVYYATWNKISRRVHVMIGWIYFVAAYLSLVVINGIITFMLTPGDGYLHAYKEKVISGGRIIAPTAFMKTVVKDNDHATGDLLLICATGEGPGRYRTPSAAYISQDDGATWKHARDIADDPDEDYGYQTLMFLEDTAILAYHKRDGLYVARIGSDWFYGK